MNLSSGNSGARLIETITKFAPDAAFEGGFCQLLSKVVCPEIFATGPGYYVMERLEQIPRTPDLLRKIELLLEQNVWNRPASNYEVTGQPGYIEFQKSMGIETPNFARPKEFCLIHGDPTVSNAMLRDTDLVLIDPRPPNGHIPSAAMVDRGKILQSWMGWEYVAYNEPDVSYNPPYFMSDKTLRKQALFWCGYHAARIEQLEISRGWNRPSILQWCNRVRRYCNV